MTAIKMEMAGLTNKVGLVGTIEEALEGADVYIGVSSGKVADEAVATMAKDAIIFALANPNPEIHPDVGNKYARVMATGRSDFPNQINNVLAFPGIFRGALDVRASAITEGMKLAAAEAIAGVVGDDLREDCVVPSVFDPRVGPTVAVAVAEAARAEGVARR
jgi:malate dehydrogenase (oxaloacetate-decarboxylating)